MNEELANHPALQPRRLYPLLAFFLYAVAACSLHAAITGVTIFGVHHGIGDRIVDIFIAAMFAWGGRSFAGENKRIARIRRQLLNQEETR